MSSKKVLLLVLFGLFTVLSASFRTVDVHAEAPIFNPYDASSWTIINSSEGVGEEQIWTFNEDDITLNANMRSGFGDMALAFANTNVSAGEYSVEANFVITDQGSTGEIWIGFVPWFLDFENFIFTSLKFIKDGDNWVFQAYVVHGKFAGADMQVWEGSWVSRAFLDNWFDGTMINQVTSIDQAEGHALKVNMLKNEFGDTMMELYYNGAMINSYILNGYRTVPVPQVGIMAFNATAEITDIAITDLADKTYDYNAINDQIIACGNWSETDNGIDVDATADTVKDMSKAIYLNPMADKNYSIETNATINAQGTGTTGYVGLIPWYIDELNFVYGDIAIDMATGSAVLEATIMLNGVLTTDQVSLPNVYNLTEDINLYAEKTPDFVVLKAQDTILTVPLGEVKANKYVGYTASNLDVSFSEASIVKLYEPYDKISIVDDLGQNWDVIGNGESAWQWDSTGITVAKSINTSSALRASNLADNNYELSADFTLSNTDGTVEFGYIAWYLDGDNYVNVFVSYDTVLSSGLIIYDYVIAGATSTETEAIIESFDFSEVELSVTKEEETFVVKLDGTEVASKEIVGTTTLLTKYGLLVNQADALITNFVLDGYRAYDPLTIGVWTVTGKSLDAWTVEDGALVVDAIGSAFERVYALQTTEILDSYYVEAEIALLDYSGLERKFGLTVWYIDDNNYINVMFDQWFDNLDPRISFTGKVDGVLMDPVWANTSWLEGLDLYSVNKLAVAVVGNTITIFLNDENIHEYTFNQPLSIPTESDLKVGYFAFGTKVEFSNFSVTTYDPSSGNNNTTDPTTTTQTTTEVTTSEDNTTTGDLTGAGCSSCSEVSPALALGGILTLFSFFIFRRKFL